MNYLIIFPILLFLFTFAACFDRSGSVGSVLFYKRSSQDCWSHDDLAKLRVRMIFEKMIPPFPPPEKMNATYIRDSINYFNRAMRQVKHKRDAHVLKEALADTIGAHMRNELLPNARFAYYAGYITFDSVNELHQFYQRIKNSLNTQGLGWNKPFQIPLQSNVTVAKIDIVLDKSSEPCSDIMIKRSDKNCIHIPVPKVDDERLPTALALPYKVGGFFSMLSPVSENVLLKYYTKAARCILQRSPDKCRHEDFVNFNNDLWHWLKQYAAPHLMDEKLYSVYGGVLRVTAAAQNYGKGLSRRNIFRHKNAEEERPARISDLYENKLFADQVYTPPLFVLVILGAALAVCCLHILYAYILGPSGACNCPGKRNRSSLQKKNTSAYTAVDSNIPAMLPPPKTTEYPDEKKHQHLFSSHESRSTGIGTDQKDLKDNLANFVLMTDKELSDTESSSDGRGTALNRTLVGSIRTSTSYNRRPRCPQIIAPVQLKKERTTRKTKNIPMYSTVNISQSEITYSGQISETYCSGSSISERSGSSFNSSSRDRPSSRSPDISWAKKVVRKQNLRSTPDYDHHNSKTTPTSTSRREK
ncbi:hypothetical protein O0L34_g12646 [Tuta absoluta]|nr:hypothetical protein O0L34_g12646 [Tuta absoluta]